MIERLTVFFQHDCGQFMKGLQSELSDAGLMHVMNDIHCALGNACQRRFRGLAITNDVLQGGDGFTRVHRV